MSKQSLTEAFNIEKSKPIINNLNDYEIFRDKTKLEELRSRIIQNLIDNNIPSDVSLEDYVNEEVNNILTYYDLSPEEREYIFNLIQREITGYGPITDLLKNDSITEIMVNGPNEI